MNNLRDFIDKHWLILAPMAGVNDQIFRRLCLKYGAMLTYTEMISSKALSFKNVKTNKLLTLDKTEKNVVVQLFGHEPNVMARQAKYVEDMLGARLSYIDINMGCPSKKIIKKGDGASLMTTPKLASEIVRACCTSCNTPISVKFRKGYNIGDDSCFEFGENMQKAGASAVCIHGRYAFQFYKGKADLDSGIKLSQNLDIPVIWSGDVTNFKEAYKIRQSTSLSGVMIGRATRGNPWVFKNDYMPSNNEKLETAQYHLNEYAKIDNVGLSHMRKHCMWYMSGFPGASVARNMFSKCNSVQEYMETFQKIKEGINNAS